MKTVELSIQGMTCAACSARIEKVLNKIDGVEASVNLPLETASIRLENGMTAEELIARIEKLGYGATVKETIVPTHDLKPLERKLLISSVLSAPLLVAMLTHLPIGIHIDFLMNPWWQFALATPVQFWIGARFYKGAYTSLRSGSANMDVLVATGTSAAYFYSVYEMFRPSMDMPALYFETSAILITLVLLGKWLEARAKQKTTGALQALLSLQAKKARLLVDGEEREVDVALVNVGDVLIVLPGDKVPVDGVVVQGESVLDESMLTGESVPIDKVPGDALIGGTLNQSGRMLMRAEKVGSETMLSQIVQVVEQAQTAKAPIQRQADKISGVFVPIVMLLSIITFLVWFFVMGDQEMAIRAAMAVLVIACPCALGLATPTSIMVGTGKAASQGVLFKGGSQLEMLNEVDAIVFDKTGTLTNGRPEVVRTFGEAIDLERAARLERDSNHPLAIAIQSETQTGEVDWSEEIAGKGIRGSVDGVEMVIGSERMMNELGYELPAWDLGQTTPVYVARDAQIVAAFGLQDQLKDGATEVINQIAKTKRVYMLTGDKRDVALSIGSHLGLADDQVIAEVLPIEKADVIKRLQQQGSVAMVGDGMNDAPALVVADVGIAFGSGTDVALEAADVTVIGHDLAGVERAIRVSDQTMRNIRQNLFWALAYNSVGIPVAAVGLLAPWVAGAAMAFSSVSVVLNALRLKKN